MIKKVQASIRIWLLALTLLVTLPFLAITGYAIWKMEQAQQEAITAELVQRTQATASATKIRLETALAVLNALATSDAAIKGDLPALYDHSKRVVAANGDIRTITLVSATNRMLFMTLLPYGASLPEVSQEDSVARVFQSGKPVLSAPFVGPVTGKRVFAVSVPVFKGQKVVYCLRMVLATQTFNDLLVAQALPTEWTAAIIDERSIVIARSRAPERYVGKEASATLKAAIKNRRQGVFDAVTLDGIPVKTATVIVPEWDWAIAIGVPVETLNGPMNHSLMQLLLLGSVFMGLGMGAAVWLARLISREMASFVAVSRAMQEGQQPRISGAQISELHEVGKALQIISEKHEGVSLALQDVSDRHERVFSELQSARCDALTGLPNRGLFMELADAKHKSLGMTSDRGLAILFLDLDGFKQINDALGHDEGDRVLISTARILQALIRDTDTAARLGGDEFILCVSAPVSGLEATVSAIASRIVNQVGAIGNGIGCSIGISLWREDSTEIADVIRSADEAMYEAKRKGKNCFVVFGGGGLPG